VPDVDDCVGNRCAGGVEYPDDELERIADSILNDIGAFERQFSLVRPLLLLGRGVARFAAVHVGSGHRAEDRRVAVLRVVGADQHPARSW
jgi:hypothetical protein